MKYIKTFIFNAFNMVRNLELRVKFALYMYLLDCADS